MAIRVYKARKNHLGKVHGEMRCKLYDTILRLKSKAKLEFDLGFLKN
jgi:hypothetical protein